MIWSPHHLPCYASFLSFHCAPASAALLYSRYRHLKLATDPAFFTFSGNSFHCAGVLAVLVLITVYNLNHVYFSWPAVGGEEGSGEPEDRPGAQDQDAGVRAQAGARQIRQGGSEQAK